MAGVQDNFLDGTSSSYLEELEERFRADPASVDKTWASFFTNLGAIPVIGFIGPALAVFTTISMKPV